MLHARLVKVVNSVYLLSLREAFITLIAFLTLTASFLVVQSLVTHFNTYAVQDLALSNISLESFSRELSIILMIYPIMMVISIGFYLSKNLGVNPIGGSLLGLVCFLTHGNYVLIEQGAIVIHSSHATIYAILIPSLSSYLLRFYFRILKLTAVSLFGISRFLRVNIQMVTPFILVFATLYLVIPYGAVVIEWIFSPFSNFLEERDLYEKGLIRQLLTSLFWLIGVHGSNAFDSLFGNSFLYEEFLPNMSMISFFDTFVFLGGAGGMFGLIIAILIKRRKDHENSIARLSIPFTLFNMNEVILYGLPIVLNPIYFIPFVLCPILNYTIAYEFLSNGWLPYNGGTVSWSMPFFIQSWIISESFVVIFFQLCLIGLNTLIYIPFVNMSYRYRAVDSALINFDESLSLPQQVANKDEARHFNYKHQAIDDDTFLVHTLEEISQGDLVLYYQPQINTTTNCLYGYESLMRLRDKEGNVKNPYFLTTLYENHISETIDRWVIERAALDLTEWRKQQFSPRISINLCPDSLLNRDLIDLICDNFATFPNQLTVEIIESNYLENTNVINQHIEKLNAIGVKVALDDFGTGYSNLSILSKLNLNIIKLDRTFLERCTTNKGRSIYSQLVKMFKELNLTVIAEGVENADEKDWVNELKVDVIQGWYYAEALPRERAHQFAMHWQLDKNVI